jgi:hypothetical protein
MTRGVSMTPATAVYRAIMLEVERRRVALGFPMEKFSEFAGLPERYYSKALHSDGANGRQAQWGTLQIIIDALFPCGFDVEIRARPGAPMDYDSLKAKLLQLRANVDPKGQRELMAQIGKKGGRRSGEMRKLAAVARKARKARAKHAASMRWSTPQIVEITGSYGDSSDQIEPR